MARPRKADAKTNAERQAAHRARDKKKIRLDLEPWAIEALNKKALEAGKTANAIAAEMITKALQTKPRRPVAGKTAATDDQLSLFE